MTEVCEAEDGRRRPGPGDLEDRGRMWAGLKGADQRKCGDLTDAETLGLQLILISFTRTQSILIFECVRSSVRNVFLFGTEQ